MHPYELTLLPDIFEVIGFFIVVILFICLVIYSWFNK